MYTNIMSKVAYQPLTVLVRAEPVTLVGFLPQQKFYERLQFRRHISLFGAVAICSNGFSAFTPRASGPKDQPTSCFPRDKDVTYYVCRSRQWHRYIAAGYESGSSGNDRIRIIRALIKRPRLTLNRDSPCRIDGATGTTGECS